MAEIRRSPRAEADLEAILEGLQRTNPAAADRYATEFHDKGQALARFPEMGHLRPEIAPNVRSTLVLPYVIFYRVEGDIVQIIRILLGKRDPLRIMKKEIK
jgi:plasmid stabilization system protein ParE